MDLCRSLSAVSYAVRKQGIFMKDEDLPLHDPEHNNIVRIKIMHRNTRAYFLHV